MLDVLLDLLFPRRSLSGTEGSFVTPEERDNLHLAPLLLTTEKLRSRGLRYLDAVAAAGRYNDSPDLKAMILTYKYKSVPVFAGELARHMATTLRECLPDFSEGSKPVLCPVPLHWVRRNERGFNQAEQLARHIAQECGYDAEELLFRVRRTGHQAHRKRSERLVALLGAFAVKPDVGIPRRVILVDDLCTTGATLEECARMLKNAGAREVYGLVAAAG